MAIDLFAPKAGETKNVAATTASSSVQLSAQGAAATSLRVYNAGSVTVFIRGGAGSATATTSDSMPIAPGSVEVFRKGTDIDTIAAITASGTATVYFTPGEGQ